MCKVLVHFAVVDISRTCTLHTFVLIPAQTLEKLQLSDGTLQVLVILVISNCSKCTSYSDKKKASGQQQLYVVYCFRTKLVSSVPFTFCLAPFAGTICFR
jgi:hypothetical protein